MSDDSYPNHKAMRTSGAENAPDEEHEAFESLRESLAQRAMSDGSAQLAYTIIDSPVGALLVAVTDVGVVRVAFATEDHDTVLQALAARISPRILRSARHTDALHRELDTYFAGTIRPFSTTIDWRLITGFQHAVLHATARIPYGTTTSYGGIAAAAGNSAAVRAAGTALGKNPIPIVIPCHRVLRADGSLGGYLGGVDAKMRLISLERRATVSH